MIFVCGIHGAGKTHYCKMLSKRLEMPYYSASNLVVMGKKQNFEEKKVKNIQQNQEILIEEIQKIQSHETDFILDGHLCLINSYGKVERIPTEVFEKLNIKSLVVIVDSVKKIKQRMEKRDDINWGYRFIDSFQKEEVKYAKELSEKLGLNLRIIKGGSEDGENIFDKNIILPIKPEYAEKILHNEKKFEYRKKLCIENIDKIYIYATSPVKRIIGEADVLEKIIMDKRELWELSKAEAGITEMYYEEYFQSNKKACAYKLGNVKKYQESIDLKEIGVYYIPQSFSYVGNIIIEDTLVRN